MHRSVVLFLILWAFGVRAGDLSRAFKALNTGNYPDAFKYFYEVLNEEPGNVAANYGLAKYYFAKDNSAFNIDSANRFIIRAWKKLPLNPEDKETKKIAQFEVRDYTIQTTFDLINTEAFNKAKATNTVQAYTHFIDNYQKQELVDEAIALRYQLAFTLAQQVNTSQAYNDFVLTFPNGPQRSEALRLYELRKFEEYTADGKYESFKKYIDENPNGGYITEARKKYDDGAFAFYNLKHTPEAYDEFLRKFPNSSHIFEVQDSLYATFFKRGSEEEYERFISKHSTNKNVADAWSRLYLLKTPNGTYTEISAFELAYPAFPDKVRLKLDKDRADQELMPFKKGNKWGFIIQDQPGSIQSVIDFEYEEVFEFSCGLAAVRAKPCEPRCSYFYIDKYDNEVFHTFFNYAGDFVNGIAIVGTGNCENESDCRYGVINKAGKYILLPIYEEVNEPTDGLYLVMKDSKYGFVSEHGEMKIRNRYDDALPFNMGVAAVALDTNWMFIDKEGAQLFPQYFRYTSSFHDSLCAVSPDGVNWGYVDMFGRMVIEARYEYAEDFNEGKGIVSVREADKKNKNIFISQRFTIDKSGKILEKLAAPKAAPVPVKSKRRK